MINISYFIAYKYILKLNLKESISTMLKISFISIFISTFALALAFSIFKGFEEETYQKMQNIHPQITIQSNKGFLNFNTISKVLNSEFPEVAAFAPNDFKNLIIKADGNQDISNLILLKGINPLAEEKVSNFSTKLCFNLEKKNLSDLTQSNQILIGQKLAKELNLAIGNQIELLVPQDFEEAKVSFKKINVKISGIFNTGMDEFDSKVIISSLAFLNKIFPDSEISQISIKLKPGINENYVIDKLRKRLKLNVFTWKDLYPALVSTLKLEKYVTFFIFLLIIIMAYINIIALLFMLITFKKKDLIIYKTMGMQDLHVKKIFLLLGSFIISTASTGGLIFAYWCSILLKKYNFIKLPDLYYATSLPIRVEPKVFFLIFICINIIGIFSIWLALYKISKLNLANELKNEL